MADECYGTVIIQDGMFRRNTISIPVRNIASCSGGYVKAPKAPGCMLPCLVIGIILIFACACNWPESPGLVVLFFTPAVIGVIILGFWLAMCKAAASEFCFVVNPKYGDPIRIIVPTQECYEMLRNSVERVIRNPDDDVYLYMDFDEGRYEAR